MFKFGNFCYHGNKCQYGLNFSDTIKLHDFENPMLVAGFMTISYTSQAIVNVVLEFPVFGYLGNKGRSGINFNDTSK